LKSIFSGRIMQAKTGYYNRDAKVRIGSFQSNMSTLEETHHCTITWLNWDLILWQIKEEL
jgi:hypothetical protein